MIDLGKPYGIHEDLVFYGDHENDRIVYYLPDEIHFARKSNGDAEVFLEMFQEEKIFTGGIEELRQTAGSILSVGAVCEVSPERLEKALASVKDAFKLSDSVVAMTPPWIDGTVDMIALDAQKSGSESTFVKKIVGSSRPSLGSLDLKSIFNVRLDRSGTELVYSAMKGGHGQVAGIMYDLQYAALRPAVQLRISADLRRCQETIRHNLDAGFKMTYYVDLSLGAQLEWLTQKMEDNGDIKVEVLSMVEKPEEKKMVDELVKEFKDSVIKELFEPVKEMESNVTVSNDSKKELIELAKEGIGALKDVTGKKGEKDGKEEDKKKEEKPEGTQPEEEKKEDDYLKYANAFHIGVTYQMINRDIEQGRKIEVDYRERSTVIKPHNPSSHLWLMKEAGETDLEKYMTTVNLGTLWKDQEVKVQLLYNFDDPDSDLTSAEVAIWRSKDGYDKDCKEGFAMKKGTEPLDSFTFSKESKEERPIAWRSEDEDDVGYYYQIKLEYSDDMLNTISPRTVFTEPVLSWSRNLLIQPNKYLYYKKYPVRAGGLDFNEVKEAELTLSIDNPVTGKKESQIIKLDSGHAEDRLIVRGYDKTALPLEISRVYYFKDGRNPVKALTTWQVDDEIVVSDPVVEKEFAVILSGIKEEITDVLLNTSIRSVEYDSMLSRTFCLSTAKGALQTIKIPFYSNSDTVTYSSTVLVSGKQVPVEGGVWTPDEPSQLVIDLATSNQRKVTLQWEGRSPDDLDLKSLKVTLKDGQGNEVKSHEFKGSMIPEPVELWVDASVDLLMDIVRKYTGGEKETDRDIPVSGGVVTIRP